jgi:hypothetical protein
MNRRENATHEASQSVASIDERVVLRLMGLIRQAWPDLNTKRANLKVVKPNGRLVWPKKQRRKELARIKAARAKPRQKNAAPLPVEEINATILVLPGAFLSDELDERYEFMRHHAHKWEVADANGRESVDQRFRELDAGFRIADGRPPLTDHEKRKEIIEGRACIERRNRLKRWLTESGVDLKKFDTPEKALFRLFELEEASL